MQRPTGVTVIAVLDFVGAGLVVLLACGAFLGGAMISTMAVQHPRMGMLMGAGAAIAGIFLLGFAALGVVTGVGLLKLQNWARILTIVLTAIGLLGSVMGVVNPFTRMHMFPFFFMTREVLSAAIEVWILVYLFRPNVKQAFGAAATSP